MMLPALLGAVLLHAARAADTLRIPDTAADWFAAMALEARTQKKTPGEAFDFVSSDNLRGYFHGRTGTHHSEPGYRIGEYSLFHGFVSRVGAHTLLRADAVRERVYPWGHEAEYRLQPDADQHPPSIREAMLLHSGQQLISLRLHSDVPQMLALQPLLDAEADAAAKATPDRASAAPVCVLRDGILLRTNAERHPFALAMFAGDGVALSCTPQVHAESRAPAQDLQLHLLFAETPDAAFENARQLRASIMQQPAQPALWRQQIEQRYRRLGSNVLWTSDADFNRALAWATASADSFVVEEFGTGIWAGLPWFRDNWGRDTFIALPGTLLVTGRYAEARAVLDNFLRFQKREPAADPQLGRVPNRVAAGDNIIYNTIDGTPWLFRSALEYLRYSGDEAFISRLVPALRAWLAGVRRHGLDEHGLLTHDAADTWMDARIDNREPWSPRGNRAVEIQALYYAALQAAAEIFARAGAHEDWQQVQDDLARVRKHFRPLFWDGQRMADRLHADGRADFSVRPNQLMLITVPFRSPFPPLLPANIEADVLRNSVRALLFEHGIASLAPDDPWFHPRHENPRFHHKDAAYHNGTIWTWNTGFTISALNRYGYAELSYALTRGLVQQILGSGTRGTLSELVDAALDEQGRVRPSGTFAQSWSVAEFVRNAWQDYLGWHPDALNGRLRLAPALPAAWTRLSARGRLFSGTQLQLHYTRENDPDAGDENGVTARWQLQRLMDHAARTATASTTPVSTISMGQTRPLPIDFEWLDAQGQRWLTQFDLADQMRVLEIRGAQARLDGQPLPTQRIGESQQPRIGRLQWRAPLHYRDGDVPVTRSVDALKRAILQGIVK